MCVKCGLNHYVLRQTNIHVGVYCGNCGTWVQWVGKKHIQRVTRELENGMYKPPVAKGVEVSKVPVLEPATQLLEASAPAKSLVSESQPWADLGEIEHEIKAGVENNSTGGCGFCKEAAELSNGSTPKTLKLVNGELVLLDPFARSINFGRVRYCFNCGESII